MAKAMQVFSALSTVPVANGELVLATEAILECACVWFEQVSSDTYRYREVLNNAKLVQEKVTSEKERKYNNALYSECAVMARE